jgi:hypothetical protein
MTETMLMKQPFREHRLGGTPGREIPNKIVNKMDDIKKNIFE